MKSRSTWFAILLAISALGIGQAQSNASSAARLVMPKDIFEALAGEVPGQGRIVIHQSEALRRLVGDVSNRYGAILSREGNTSLLQGYRIQFFSGNSAKSRSEASARAALIRQLAPEYTCYISYQAPFWRLVVGDFLSMSEAREIRQRLIDLLPSWSKESYVVKDKVRIVNYEAQLEE